jgi:hypothetical protein
MQSAPVQAGALLKNLIQALLQIASATQLKYLLQRSLVSAGTLLL